MSSVPEVGTPAKLAKIEPRPHQTSISAATSAVSARPVLPKPISIANYTSSTVTSPPAVFYVAAPASSSPMRPVATATRWQTAASEPSVRAAPAMQPAIAVLGNGIEASGKVAGYRCGVAPQYVVVNGLIAPGGGGSSGGTLLVQSPTMQIVSGFPTSNNRQENTGRQVGTV